MALFFGQAKQKEALNPVLPLLFNVIILVHYQALLHDGLLARA